MANYEQIDFDDLPETIQSQIPMDSLMYIRIYEYADCYEIYHLDDAEELERTHWGTEWHIMTIDK